MANQPNGMRAQYVAKRNNTTADVATAAGTPAVVVSPVISANSIAPNPPGVGANDPTVLPTR